MEYIFNDDNFEKEVIEADVPVIVDVFASWCGPCKMLAPTIKELSEEYDGKVKIGKLDSDENSETALKYKVQFLPTLLFFKCGKLIETLVGLQDKAALKEVIENKLL